MDEEDRVFQTFSPDAKLDFNFTLISWIHTGSKQSYSNVSTIHGYIDWNLQYKKEDGGLQMQVKQFSKTIQGYY